MTVPYAFGNTPTGQSIPLSHLDDNFDAVGNSANVSFIQNALGAVRRTSQSKMADVVSVLDFGADPTGSTDSTAAIQAAQQASKYVYCPPGDYSVSGLRIYNKVNLIGAGYENTRFLQRNPAQPAINCLSDATVGQLLSLRLENFGVVGHASASVEAVRFEALGAYAIYRSNFDFIIGSCYQAVNMQAYPANNIFYCSFKFDIVNTVTTSVVINGGSYNTFDMFIAAVGNSRMLQHEGFGNVFTRLIGEGQIYCTGQSTTYISPTIEEILTAPPTPHAIYLNGTNQVLLSPNIILNAASSANVTYCIRPFSKSWIANPRFLVNGTLHPFDKVTGSVDFTLQGPGQNNCVNKMETIYTGSASDNDLRGVAKIGDLTTFMSGASVYNGATTQYLAPTTSFNLAILNNTDMLILQPTGVIPVAGLSLAYSGVVRLNGQRLTVYTSDAITSAVWNGNGSDVSLFPASFTAGQIFRAVYNASLNKWFPC